MDLNLAAHVAERIRRCADSLGMTVTVVKPYLNDSEFTAYSHRVGKTVAELGFVFLFPIYDHYPQLKPNPRQLASVSSTETVDYGSCKPENADVVAETVRSTSEKVRLELLDVLKTIQQRTDPHEATEFAHRTQEILDLLTEVRI